MSDDSPPSATQQAGRFGIVGVINGAIDFSVFSILRAFGVSLVVSNVLSVSVGMAFSFVANRRFVFVVRVGHWRKQAFLFFVTTAFSMYVLQNLVIVALVRFVPVLLEVAESVASRFGVRSDTGVLLVRSNAAKAAATAVSLIWNFCSYRWLVFAEDERRQPASLEDQSR